MTDSVAQLLEHALQLDASGDNAAAMQAFLQVLSRDPAHFIALNELARLAQQSGRLAAARTAYEQAVHHHPDNPIGRVNLGHLLYEAGELAGARAQYEAALLASADFSQAHQGLARVLSQLGEQPSAELHRCRGFGAEPVITRRFRGIVPPVEVLLLVSTGGGNIPVQRILDDRIFATTALYPEFYPPERDLPSHAVVFNAIGDADLCDAALAQAQVLCSQTTAPIVNAPARVRLTRRAAQAARLSGLPGVIVPDTRSVARAALAQLEELRYPLLLRSPGFHTGRHFVRIERAEQLTAAAAALPGDELLVIQYLDARAADGLVRKYRVMSIDGTLYPLHLAISTDWKVHYFSSRMHLSGAYRDEERHFLEDMRGALGAGAVAALQSISRRLGLDYAGIDFGIDRRGAVLLFEANATMVINPAGPEPMWDYRRGPVNCALEAARTLLRTRAANRPAPA